MDTKEFGEMASGLMKEMQEVKALIDNTEARQPTNTVAEKGFDSCRAIAGFAAAYIKNGSATREGVKDVAKGWGDRATEKNLNGLSINGNNMLIPPQLDPQIMEVLQPASIFMEGGPEVRQYVGRHAQMRRWDSTILGKWRGECMPADKQSVSTALVDIKAHTLSVDIPICRELRMQTPQSLEADIRQHIQRGFGESVDRAMFSGNGDLNLPLGLTGWAQHKETASVLWGTATADEIEDELFALELKLLQKDVIKPSSRMVWFMSPLNRVTLFQQRAGVASEKYFPEMRDGNLLYDNYRYLSSNTVGDEFIYLVDMSKVVVGNFGNGLDIRILNETQDSCPGEIVVRADMDIGFAARYGGVEIAQLKVR